MKTHRLEIDDDVYQYLLDNVQEIGESASSILRRLLGIKPRGRNGGPPSGRPQLELDDRSQRLVEYVDGELRGRNVTTKYLAILSFLHEQDADRFEAILAIRGRKRQYFGRDRQEIADSGTSTHPKQIPGSPFWALTNADTDHKREILARVLDTLGYEQSVIARTVTALC